MTRAIEEEPIKTDPKEEKGITFRFRESWDFLVGSGVNLAKSVSLERMDETWRVAFADVSTSEVREMCVCYAATVVPNKNGWVPWPTPEQLWRFV